MNFGSKDLGTYVEDAPRVSKWLEPRQVVTGYIKTVKLEKVGERQTAKITSTFVASEPTPGLINPDTADCQKAENTHWATEKTMRLDDNGNFPSYSPGHFFIGIAKALGVDQEFNQRASSVESIEDYVELINELLTNKEFEGLVGGEANYIQKDEGGYTRWVRPMLYFWGSFARPLGQPNDLLVKLSNEEVTFVSDKGEPKDETIPMATAPQVTGASSAELGSEW